MPALKTYDLFISHAWRYGDSYEHLVYLLDNAPYFHYRNYSAPSDKPLHNLDMSNVTTKTQIRSAINRKIQPVNCVLVLSGMYVSYREWMQYEIDTAQSMGKPIIGIHPWGSTYTPIEVSSVANEMVGWNTHSIVHAIRRWSI